MEKTKTTITNICRIILGITFVFSGFVKAIDPLGTQYKFEDYLAALSLTDIFPSWILLGASVLLSAFEFTMGVMLILAIGRKLFSRLALAFMAVMTLTTVWIFIADPVKDCGCFGDALLLSNGQTLLKNIILLACCVVIATWPHRMVRLLSKSNQWIVFHYTILYSIVTSIYCLYYLPLFDFRPYKVGTNIKEAMEIPEDAEQPEFATTFIMEKDGVRKEFTLEEYPDSTWTFVDSHTIQTKEGYVPPIHDFEITTTEGEDITDDVLEHKGFTFLLIAPWLEHADDSNFGYIDELCEYAEDNGHRFLCLTSSNEKGISHWRDITGAEYEICNADGTTLKTIIRSNPGLLLIKDGEIQAKWSHNKLPHGEDLTTAIDQAPWAKQSTSRNGWQLFKVVMLFFIPLIILVIADRLWAWSQWLKHRRSHKKDEEKSENNKED